MFDQGGFDLQGLLAQAQAMQAQFENAQAELASRTVTGSAGGDLVEVTVSGTGQLLSVKIKPEACDPEDADTLGDLIVAAVRDADRKVQILASSSMPALPNLPDLGL